MHFFRSAAIFSAQAQLADENGSQQIEEISVIGQFVPDEKRSTDAVIAWLTQKSLLALVTLILRASRGYRVFLQWEVNMFTSAVW